MSRITRRDFLKMSAAAASAGASLPFAAAEPVKKKWYKGDLHQHSQWSDGIHFPERMADFYR
ncbi:MAG: twin-arginine translocation signal domain-containing protein, partial [Thermoguttaceae bacterium]|nr:twin-arginine translocation signal domain-containing protein [Thermoguttaceae bacterium]